MFRKWWKDRRTEKKSEEEEELLRLYLAIGDAGLGMCGNQSVTNAEYLRTACDLARKYKIHFYWSIGGVTACLPKESWSGEINKSVPAGQYGSFYRDIPDEKKDELISISGHGGTSFVKAIFRCVMNARYANVI